MSDIDLASFFDLEPIIVEQLRKKLPQGVQVLCGDDLAALRKDTQPTPAVHVIYNSYVVDQSSANGKTAIVRPSWLVVVVVKHTGATPKASAEAKQRAAKHIATVLDALMGFRTNPRPGTPGLKLATPPKPVPDHPYYYFPNLFTADVPVTSRSNT